MFQLLQSASKLCAPPRTMLHVILRKTLTTISQADTLMRPALTPDSLRTEAAAFAAAESRHREASLYSVTDGKAVGTYLERKFKKHLEGKYSFVKGNAARGIDFPGIDVDMKVTSIRQPQSSSPYKSAVQKVRGLGYSLLVFVYIKKDDEKTRTSTLDVAHTIWIESSRTADYQTTRGIREIIERDGNVDDLVAFLQDRRLPMDDSDMVSIAEELLMDPPELGYLTISNALQWRLQYTRAIGVAGTADGVLRVV